MVFLCKHPITIEILKKEILVCSQCHIPKKILYQIHLLTHKFESRCNFLSCKRTRQRAVLTGRAIRELRNMKWPICEDFSSLTAGLAI